MQKQKQKIFEEEVLKRLIRLESMQLKVSVKSYYQLKIA